GLVGEDDAILEPLEKDDRTRQPVGVVDGRPLAVELLARGEGGDEDVLVARLELVVVAAARLAGQAHEVADAVVGGAGLEQVAGGERAQRGVAAGAAAGDGQARPVDLAARDEVAGAVFTVLDVDDAPLALEPIAVGAAVAGAAAVVDVQVGEAAAGPV